MYNFESYIPILETLFDGQLPRHDLATQVLKGLLENFPQLNPNTTLMVLEERQHRLDTHAIRYPYSEEKYTIDLSVEPVLFKVPIMTFRGWLARRFNHRSGWEMLSSRSRVSISSITEKIKLERFGLVIEGNDEGSNLGKFHFWWIFGYSCIEDILVFRILELGEYEYSVG